MNHQKRLAPSKARLRESHKRMYSWIEENAKKNRWLSEDDRTDWIILEGCYPELLMLVEDLIRDLGLVNSLLGEKEVEKNTQ